MKPSELLSAWLSNRLSPSAYGWLQEKSAQIAAGAPERIVVPAFSAALRHAGKEPLAPDAAALKAAAAASEGWNPSDWSLADAARILLLLSLPQGEASAKMLTRMWQTADVGEAVALQKALPLLPDPPAYMAWAREGVRSNIKLVFDALVLRNPYPARHFDDIGWNQIVAKSFFMDSPLEAVWGLDRRTNPALARMLTDLAFERWAAGRTIGPLVWRCIGPVAGSVPNGRAFEALGRALQDPDPAHRRAAALGLASCKDPEASRLLASAPDLAAAVQDGSLTWETLNG
jgi:hypothetical protein